MKRRKDWLLESPDLKERYSVHHKAGILRSLTGHPPPEIRGRGRQSWLTMGLLLISVLVLILLSMFPGNAASYSATPSPLPHNGLANANHYLGTLQQFSVSYETVATSHAIEIATPTTTTPTFDDDTIFTAVVVVRAASGASYMDDREYIATMPMLETDEEIADFIAKYEPAEAEGEAVRVYLEERGCRTVAHDNLFLIIAGTHTCFAGILDTPDVMTSAALHAEETAGRLQSFRTEDFKVNSTLSHIDGMLILPQGPELNPMLPSAPQSASQRMLSSCEPPTCYNINDVADLLRARYVHETIGLTGQGVRIGFVDSGVAQNHSFFQKNQIIPFRWIFKSSINADYYVIDNQRIISKVRKNYINAEEDGFHGTMVAAFLSAFAPDAQLLSFRYITEADGDPILFYLTYMNQHQLVDIVSLSMGSWEKTEIWQEVDLVRTQILNLISQRVIVLIAAGNAGQCNAEGFCSGHNALAAIPEVIAVGGANTDLTAAGGYPGTTTGAASFESQLYPGRFVPDIVGIYGPTIRYPGVSPLHYITDDNGTSGATPQIAGIVALLKQRHPFLTQSQVRAILQNSAYDITEGVSGDDDPTGPGYDLATGYGLPLATHVIGRQVNLFNGWNLIGLTNDHSTDYTAIDMLREVNRQGGNCDGLTRWRPEVSRYDGIIIDGDDVYGFDFSLELGVGYWLRCQSHGVWEASGTVNTVPQTLHLIRGWNLISIPYSEYPVTVSDVLFGTSGSCKRVVDYDGKIREVSSYGPYFPLSPGKGYFVLCRAAVDWTPTGTEAPHPYSIEPIRPGNVYHANASATASSLRTTLNLYEKEQVISSSDQQCVPQAVTFANITNQQFSVSWTTDVPCMGSVIIHNGTNPVYRAFDDRGIRFSGTTHHVTIRGLLPETMYSFGLLSGDIWDTNAGEYYQIQTGADLNMPTYQYRVQGQIVDRITSVAQDAVVYAQLENQTTNPATPSTLLSFPIDKYTNGYGLLLDNTRVADGTAYFDYTAASHLKLSTQGGSAGQQAHIVSVDLRATPDITATTMILTDAIPDQPDVIAPNGIGVVVLQPTFSFTATDRGGRQLTYRFELSTNNFASVERVYDQRDSVVGWSAATYASGAEARFTIPEQLQDSLAYQWRVFAYNGEAWSIGSDIAAFGITRCCNLYLPLVLRNASSNVTPGPTPTPSPTATVTPAATPTPDIPAPIEPTATPTPTPIPTPQTIHVSVSSSGQQGNDNSTWPSISADGRYVVFQSSASNLVAGDTNGVEDVFIYDIETGQTERVSIASDGSQGDGASGYYTAISADGNYIAFESVSSNLVSGDTNQKRDVFVHNRQTGETIRVSVASDGTQSNGDSGRYGLSISVDGRYVTFKSYADNLVSGGRCGVLVHDHQTAQTTCVSVDSNGTVRNGAEPSISADGRYVVFEAPGDLLSGGYSSSTDIYVRDLQTSQTVRASVASNGAVADRPSNYPAISPDGRYVAFISRASNLVSGDTNEVEDVFVHDLQTRQTTRVSIAHDGSQASALSGWRRSPAISDGGRYVAFMSSARLVSNDTDNQSDVYIRDRQTNQTICVSVSNNGAHVSTGSSYFISMSGDGRRIAFTSTATNLVTGDTNDSADVFVRDRGAIE